MLTDVGPVELWATRLRRPSAAANPQGFCWPLTPPLPTQRILPSRSPRYTATSGVDKLKRDRGSEGARHWGASSRRKLRGTIKIVIFRRALPLSNPWLEPIVDCGFDARRTSHSVAVQERLAPQSLILEVIGLGRVGPHCIAAYRSHCLRRSARPDPTRLIRPRGTRDNASAFPDASDWLHDSTRRDLAMGDISRQGDEQFAGERYDRDAAGPGPALGQAAGGPTAGGAGRR